MSVLGDRRPLAQIGGLCAYLRQVFWSIRWGLRHRGRASTGHRQPPPVSPPPPATASDRGRRRLVPQRD